MTRHCSTDQSKAGGTYTTPRNKDLYEMKAKTPAELKKFPSIYLRGKILGINLVLNERDHEQHLLPHLLSLISGNTVGGRVPDTTGSIITFGT